MGLGDAPSVRVVKRVAAADDVDPTELTPPLADVVDPEALDTLVRSTDRELTVEFPYHEYSVRVDESGRVSVSESDRATNGRQGRNTE